MKKILCISLLALLSSEVFSQGAPDYGSGMKISFDQEGTKTLRIIAWGQMWAQYQEDVPDGQKPLEFSTRRARLLTYAQFGPKFLILAHFGLNSLHAENMSPLGKDNGSQLFFHDFYVQYSLAKNHAIGTGLHYWNGISRLNSQSTLNLMTLDNNRQSWATLGLTDQFARHQGVYAKGSIDKFQYRIALNEAITNGLDSREVQESPATTVYAGRRVLGSGDAGFNYAGYFEYNFLDQESNFLPYKVGSYMGTKKVFNLGAGFFVHPKGSLRYNGGTISGEDVLIFAVDAFYDAPLGERTSAITAYAVYQNNRYGADYLFGVYGTGSMLYGHLGYLLPTEKLTRLQPYVSYASNRYDATPDLRNVLGIGTNLFMKGHHSKLTVEYKNEKFGGSQTKGLTLQAMIYL